MSNGEKSMYGCSDTDDGSASSLAHLTPQSAQIKSKFLPEITSKIGNSTNYGRREKKVILKNNSSKWLKWELWVLHKKTVLSERWNSFPYYTAFLPRGRKVKTRCEMMASNRDRRVKQPAEGDWLSYCCCRSVGVEWHDGEGKDASLTSMTAKRRVFGLVIRVFTVILLIHFT